MLMLLVVSNSVKMFVSFNLPFTTLPAISWMDTSVSFLYIVCQEGFDVPKGWRPDLGNWLALFDLFNPYSIVIFNEFKYDGLTPFLLSY